MSETKLKVLSDWQILILVLLLPDRSVCWLVLIRLKMKNGPIASQFHVVQLRGFTDEVEGAGSEPAGTCLK